MNNRAMKDSGVEWMGEIPENWKIVKLGRFLDRVSTGLNPRNNFVLGDGNNFYVTIKNFKHGKLFLDNRCDKISDEAKSLINKRSDLKEGDLLFASISKTGDAYLIKTPPLNWDINESVFTIRTNKKYLLPEFLFHAITSSYFYEKLLSEATGTTFKSIKMEKLKNNNLLCPPLHEQQAIATYLDNQVSRLDRLINDQQRVIEEWKAYKQSLITETVTKGLNPEVELKDSGIEWMGEIPSHWEVIKLKFLSGIKTGDKDTVNKVDNGLYPFFVRSPKVERIDSYSFDGEAVLTAGDGDVGKIFHHIKGKFDFHQRVYCFYDFKKCSGRFFYYFMSVNFIKEVGKGTAKTTVESLRLPMIKNFNLSLPPLHEQQQIADFLDEKCLKIDQLIEDKQRLIEELKAYKQSLIYECVTGKKEIV